MHTHTHKKMAGYMRSKRFNDLFGYCPMKTMIFQQINPILFDVSLRDGIQGFTPAVWTTQRKRDLFLSIFNKETPTKMEIGSLVSGKILSVMSDSMQIHKYITDYLREKNSNIHTYMLVPNSKKLREGLEYGLTRFSFITSVSEKFQMKNTNLTLQQTKSELAKMNNMLLTNSGNKKYAKLYISCISECPIRGQIPVAEIAREILEYNDKYEFDELCLSDTCGTLTYERFSQIIMAVKPFIHLSKLSLHLHVSQNLEEVRDILFCCFDSGINKFDISAVESGGCNVTMSGKNNLPNLSYDLFYDTLNKYVERELS